MSSAPHLPEKQNSESQSSLGWLFLIVVLSGLTGITAALVTIAWLTPQLVENGVNRISIESRAEKNKEIKTLTKEQIDQRTVKIYDAEDKIEGRYYKNDYLSDAAVLSSDGWVVMYRPNYKKGEYLNWEAINNKGVIHEIDEAVYDRNSKLLYLHLKEGDFRVASIADWGKIQQGKPVWIYNSDYSKEILRRKAETDSSEVKNLLDLHYQYRLSDKYETGSLVLNQQGELVGFLDEAGKITPSWYVSNQLNNVLADKEINYNFPRVKGIMIDRMNSKKERTKPIAGMYVTYASSNKIKRGDILKKINGEKIKKKSLSKQAIIAKLPYALTITRGDKTKTIQISKQK